MRILTFLLTMSLLNSCVPDSDAVKLHDISLYGTGNGFNFTNGYFFGKAKTLEMGTGETKEKLVLSEDVVPDVMYVDKSLSVNKKPYLQRKLSKLKLAPTLVSYIPLTTDLRLAVNEDVAEVAYYDGAKWFSLLDAAQDGFDANLTPSQRIGGLHGFGGLNNAETDMLMRYLEPKAPIVITELNNHKPEKLPIDGLNEYQQAVFYVQNVIHTDNSAYVPPAEKLIWDIVAQGSNAIGSEEPEYYIVKDQSSLLSVWNKFYGNQLSVPELPPVDFDKETIVAILMGQKATGGYALDLKNISLDNNELFIDLKQIVPGEGAITTQAFTNPWMLIKILRGGLDLAWLRDPDSLEIYGVAKPLE